MAPNEFVPDEDLRALGLDPAAVVAVELIHERHGNRLYRVRLDERRGPGPGGARTYVLKWFGEPVTGESGLAEPGPAEPGPAEPGPAEPGPAAEIHAYELLRHLGIPTLPVHGLSPRAILLEDLDASPVWRRATEEDVLDAATGVAVAQWYRAFHAAGRRVVTDPAGPPGFLKREVDELNPEVIRDMGRRLGLPDLPVWRLAAYHIETFKAAMRALPETLNYNDFYWTNLALARPGRPPAAIIYDYHLVGIGLPYSDCRNVAGSLGEPAGSAFWEAYGPVDERQRLLDEPTSTLYSLLAAMRLPRFPRWGESSLEEARSGRLGLSIRLALEALGEIGQ